MLAQRLSSVAGLIWTRELKTTVLIGERTATTDIVETTEDKKQSENK